MEHSLLSSEEKARLLRALAEHLTAEQVVEFAAGDAREPERSAIQRHLSLPCDACQEAVDEARTRMKTFETPEGRKRMEGLWNSVLASVRPQTLRPQSDPTAHADVGEMPSLVAFARLDTERDVPCELPLPSGAVLSVRSRVGESLLGETIIALTTDSPRLVEPDRLAIRVVHDATRHANVRFLDRQGRAVVPMPAGLRGTFRVEVAPIVARCAIPTLTMAQLAAAPVGGESPIKRTRQVEQIVEQIVESPLGSLTVKVFEHPGGSLEVQATGHEPQQLENATVHVQFRTADGDAVSLQGAGANPVDVTISLTDTIDGKPFGAWKNEVNVPRDVSRCVVVVFPADGVKG